MSYCMNHVDDNQRLTLQAEIQCYSPQDDFKHFSIPQNAYVLDAGCGPGIFSRYLYDNYTHKIDALDFDQEKIRQAKLKSAQYDINYFQGDITNLIGIKDNTYDVVVSRYVIQHLESPLTALTELKRVLKPGGKLIIIESSGVFFNIYSGNQFLNECLETLKDNFKFDLFVGEKIPGMMKSLDLQNIVVATSPMEFLGEERVLENDNYKSRFEMTRPLFDKILGEKKSQYFVDTYLNELNNPQTGLEYHKNIVEGIK